MPWTRASLRHALERRGRKPRKGLGQHFLVDPDVCRAIVDAGDLPPGADVLEIGCGPGLLTVHLAPVAGRLLAIDIDPDMAALCREALAGAANVDVLEKDILDAEGRIDIASGVKRGASSVERTPPDAPCSALHAVRSTLHAPPSTPLPLYVYGNLPYNIAVNILVALLDWAVPVARIVVLVQSEVADRMTARPCGEQYGPLSVVAQAFAGVDVLRRVPPSAFWPAPKVESAVIRLGPHVVGAEMGRARQDWDALQGLFRGRRKRLGNVLGDLGLDREAARVACVTAGADVAARAESLAPEVLARLAKIVSAIRTNS
jgi:16S rRNA (adenine1518-N6/adenine1519-N6)-dimethyltransferase